MKNFINYYYNFFITDIHLYQGKCFFSYNGENYMFKPCDDIVNMLDSIYNLTQQLRFTNSFYHQLVYNKDNSLVTVFERRPYVMIKLSAVLKTPISIFDIKGNDYVQTDKKLGLLSRFDWTVLWENKIDYFEKQVFTKTSEYSPILVSFHYFIGMAENAIMYVREALVNQKKESSDQLVVSHRRFTRDMTLVDFYDPTNLIVDHKSRDIAEFLKYSFLINNYDIRVIGDYLNKIDLSNLGAHLLFGRLLFPSFYFDFLEELFARGKFENIYNVETRVGEYKLFLADIFEILRARYRIQEISWITKKM